MVAGTAPNNTTFTSVHSVALAAHLPGTLRVRYTVIWAAAANAAATVQAMAATTAIPGQDRTHNNGDTTSKPVKGIADGYIATDGAAKTIFGQVSSDAGGSTVTIVVGAIQVWQV